MLLHTTRNQNRQRSRYHVDLTGLQAVCDANYLRILRITPRGPAGTQRFINIEMQGHEAEACLEIREQTKYTTLLHLSLVQPFHRWLPLPNLSVRLYHDVRMAEVVAADHHRGLDARYSYPNPEMYQPDEKHQLNKLLSEWLQHCLQAGKTPTL
ncbi:DUF1249 domain-containing protein [Sansalvadorimonas verongulae]|uniref:DUF1249 domain-containing protein n=1 Tax=Sansalvadorimonas verongulae TaxID=2172824 RepID=UPI0012BD1E71|nr:DUF1249 domain-containing protein [Sansalvadorimonas verongulae]MTI15073.1 DUF1249 domain-containing protein [Sansalvadorimonas verongulae]